MIERRKDPFRFITKHGTYHYLKELYEKGKRVVISRYGDGEYWIMTGVKKKKGIAGQVVTDELIELLNKSFKKEGQLVCLPNKIIISKENLYEDDKILKNQIARYIIHNSKHNLYGQVQWRDIDLLRYNSEFVTEFFVEKTLVITGHKEICERAFNNRKGVTVDIYGVPMKNASGEYKNIKNDLISISKDYKNIIFSS